jgi:hypothetical protein
MRALVVRGDRSGVAEVTFATNIRLRRPPVSDLIGSVHTEGRYSGFWLLDRESNERLFGVFYYDHEIQSQWAREHRWPTLIGNLPMTLKAGTYKLAFFTEGPARIELPMSSVSKTVTITHQSARPLRVQYAAADPQVVPQAMVGTTSLPLYFGRNDFAVLGVAEAGDSLGGVAPVMTSSREMCLARPAEPQCLPVGDRCLDNPGTYACLNQWRGPWQGGGHSIGGASGSSAGTVFYYQRSFQKIPPGQYEPYFRVISGRSNVKMEAFALNVDLPPFDDRE